MAEKRSLLDDNKTEEYTCIKCQLRLPANMIDLNPRSKTYKVCVYCRAKERELYGKK